MIKKELIIVTMLGLLLAASEAAENIVTQVGCNVPTKFLKTMRMFKNNKTYNYLHFEVYPWESKISFLTSFIMAETCGVSGVYAKPMNGARGADEFLGGKNFVTKLSGS